jgi:hypothetical protein
MEHGILYIGLPLASLISTPFIRDVFDVQKQANYRRASGSLFWASIPFGVVSLVWSATGDNSVLIQNILLASIGAVIGASGLVYLGHVVRDQSRPPAPPLAQQSDAAAPLPPPMGTGVEIDNSGTAKGGIRGNTFIIKRMGISPGGKGIVLSGPNIEDNSFEVHDMEIGETPTKDQQHKR